MDSVNTGSSRSSSDGDDDNSRATSDIPSSFMNTTTNTASKLSSHSLPPPPPAFFDLFSPSYNIDPVWPEPSCRNTLTSQSLVEPTPGPFAGPPPRTSCVGPATRPDQPPQGVVKSSRKRTRASRRAPTTVLTTDASNFRQMVQEFTGIPAPPFPSSCRLGPIYPFRPSAQKLTIANATPSYSPTAASVIRNNIFSNPYNRLPDNSNLTCHSNTNNLQNQLLSQQSLLFGSLKSQGNPFGDVGATQDRTNVNLSVLLSGAIGRENNSLRVQENNAIATRNQGGAASSWNHSQGL